MALLRIDSHAVIYLSHSANRRSNPDWWIVEPRDDTTALLAQVASLLAANRRVLRVNVVRRECVELYEGVEL